MRNRKVIRKQKKANNFLRMQIQHLMSRPNRSGREKREHRTINNVLITRSRQTATNNKDENIQGIREGWSQGRGQTGMVLARILFSMDLGLHQETNVARRYWFGNQRGIRHDTGEEYHKPLFVNRRDCLRIKGQQMVGGPVGEKWLRCTGHGPSEEFG